MNLKAMMWRRPRRRRLTARGPWASYPSARRRLFRRAPGRSAASLRGPGGVLGSTLLRAHQATISAGSPPPAPHARAAGKGRQPQEAGRNSPWPAPRPRLSSPSGRGRPQIRPEPGGRVRRRHGEGDDGARWMRSRAHKSRERGLFASLNHGSESARFVPVRSFEFCRKAWV